MKKRICLIVCAIMLFTTVFSVFPANASESTLVHSVVYVSEAGGAPSEIPSALIYNDLVSAVNALSLGGTIYICGDTALPLSLTAPGEDMSVTIKGYPGTSARALFPTSGVKFTGNITFDNMIIKGAAKDESWTRVSEGTLRFGSGCAFELSDPYTHSGKTVTSGIYIGHNSEGIADGHYVFDSPYIEYNMVSSLGLYGSAYVVTGDLTFDLNDGIFKNIIGGVRNGYSGNSSFQSLYGDSTFNLNGGTYSKIYTNNISGGYVEGNIVFNINGGTYPSGSKLIFGNSAQTIISGTVSSANYSSVGNIAVIADAKKLSENSSTISMLSISESEVFSDIPCDNSMIILNHSENSGYLPTVSVTNVDYLVKVKNGVAVPVFEESGTDGTAGEFLGFDITADNSGYTPYINGSALTKNSNGYYNIPKSSGGSFVEVYFENPLAGQYFDVTFVDPDIPSSAYSISVEGNHPITLPVCEFEKDFCFIGWNCNGNTYASGESFTVNDNYEFSALWMKKSLVQAVYVNEKTGDNASSGASRFAPVKSFDQAVANADEYGANKIVLMTEVTGAVNIPAGTERLVVTGKDDSCDYGGALIVSSTSKLQRPVTFEYMGLGCEQYQFICTSSNHIIFGDGLRSVSGLGISAHFGNEYAAASTVDVEIQSGLFDNTFFGGAYLSSEMPGVTGDAKLKLSKVENFVVNIGFDGYTGRNSNGSIEGSAEIIIKSGNISEIKTSRLSEIKGALYVICYGSAIVPAYSTFPEANEGSYSIRVISDGTVAAAVDENGDIKPGYINAVCDDPEKAVRITMDNGSEFIYDQGEIYLYPGNYTVEYIEKGSLESASFTIDAPIAGHQAEKLYFATDKYFATGEWLCDGEPVDRFEFLKSYTISIRLTPCQAIDTSAFTSAKINGSNASVTANDDGSYTISRSFGEILSKNFKYVSSTNGSDSNSGSSSAPYATLSKAVSSIASRGGVIYICDSVNVGETLPENTKNIVITGDGYPDAELYLNKNAGSLTKGAITFENIHITMGQYSHFNDLGNKFVFADSVDMDGNVHHLGTYSTTNADSVNVTIGKNVTLSGVHLGGAYHPTETTVSGDVELTVRGRVKSLIHGCDAFQANHVGSIVEGNILVTIDDGGQIDKITTGSRDLTVSDTTVYQFVFNNGAHSLGAIEEGLIPVEKAYRVYSGIGGRVLHAKDENGESVSGSFDIIPDDNNYAIIQYNNHMALTKGGRYQFPSNTDITISYVTSEHALKTYIVELNGGIEKASLLSIDADGNITFLDSPVKRNYIFEGWYYDADFTELATTGDYVGEKLEIYAKYAPLSLDLEDEEFVIRGVQMRLPDDSSSIQGLRFITITDNEAIETIAGFSDKNTEMLRPVKGYASHYGSVVLPTNMIGGHELVLDGEYYKNGKTYSARSAKGENLFNSTSDKTEYTVCLLDISPEKYEYAYTVRPYITYYSRSGNLSTLYGNAYSIDVMKTTFAALESGTESEENEAYMRETILPEYAKARDIELLPVEVLETVETKTEQYKQNVVNSANMDLSSITGTIYYVSPNGSDSNNGKSASSPWKTLAKVNATTFKSGDAILFERGAEFRGKIVATAPGLTFSAYGTGAKPIINGSKQDYADPSLWVETDIENVYKLTVSVNDVGLVALNHSKKLGVYDELMGTMRVSGVSYDGKLFTNQYDLDTDLHAYSNLATNTLYMYSAKGNPGERFSSIELGEDKDLLEISSKKNMTVDNIDFRYGGGHGIGGSGGLANYDSNGNFTDIVGCSNLTVTNCIFSWIGGSNLHDTTRYGNAIEIFGSVNGYHVENNWVYQIYDTGVTHQVSSSSVGNTLMQDILYKDNLIEYCHWSIEFYNQNCECCVSLETPVHSRIVRNVLSEGNIVRMGGYGWGSRIRQDGATLYNSFGLSRVASETENFHAKNNIFFRCASGMYRIYNNASEDNLTFESNLWIQDHGAVLAWYKGGTYRFLNDAESYFVGEESHLKEVDTQGVYFYAP